MTNKCTVSVKNIPIKIKGQVKFQICKSYTLSCKLNDKFLNSREATDPHGMPIKIMKITGNFDAHMTYTTKKDIDKISF